RPDAARRAGWIVRGYLLWLLAVLTIVLALLLAFQPPAAAGQARLTLDAALSRAQAQPGDGVILALALASSTSGHVCAEIAIDPARLAYVADAPPGIGTVAVSPAGDRITWYNDVAVDQLVLPQLVFRVADLAPPGPTHLVVTASSPAGSAGVDVV